VTRKVRRQQAAGAVLVELLSAGAEREVWSGQTADGAPCTVTLLALGAESSWPDEAALSALRCRHLPRVDEVATVEPPVGRAAAAGVTALGQVAVRTEAVDGPSLAAVLGARRWLGPGEVVGLGAALAEALSELHTAGLAHGSLSPADVVVCGGRRGVVLTGAGLAAASSTADVHALAVLLQAVLVPGGADALPVLAALAPALAGHPAARPRAGELAAALREAAPAVPVVTAGVVGSPTAAAGSHRAPDPDLPPPTVPRTRLLVTAAGGGACLLLALVVVPTLRAVAQPPAGRAAAVAPTPTGAAPTRAPLRGSAATAPAAASVPASSSVPLARGPGPSRSGAPAAVEESARSVWAARAQGIADARLAAYRAGDASRLDEVDAAGSGAAAADRAGLGAYAVAGVRVRDGRAAVTVLRVVTAGRSEAELDITESQGAYSLIDATGRVLARRPASPAAAYRLTLVRTPPGWRAAAVRPLDQPSAEATPASTSVATKG